MHNSSLSFLERLLLWHKFVIISVVALVLTSIPTYLYMREADKSMAAAVLETEGLAPVAAALKTIQLTQQHRGLSALVLGGVDSAKEQREGKQRQADQAYAALDAIVKGLHNKGSEAKAIEAAWEPALRDWEALRAAVASRAIPLCQTTCRVNFLNK